MGRKGSARIIWQRWNGDFRVWLINPRRGRHREEIASGYRSFPQGEHLIFYVIQNRGIVIIGILHQRMDAYNYFSR